MEAQSGSMLESLGLPALPPLAFEGGSSDEEYYDAADKLTPPDTLSGEPLVPLPQPSRSLPLSWLLRAQGQLESKRQPPLLLSPWTNL